MLFPKKVKYRKWQTKRTNPGHNHAAHRGTQINFGSSGLKAVDEARIRSNQIEAARRALSRGLGKTGKIWIRIFPDRPITSKPAEVKLGKGKGDVEGFCASVKPGRMLFEVDGVTEEVATEALRKASAKLPLKTKTVHRS